MGRRQKVYFRQRHGTGAFVGRGRDRWTPNFDVVAKMPPRSRHALLQIFAAVRYDALCWPKALDCARGSEVVIRHNFCDASKRPRHPSNYLSGQRTVQKKSTKSLTRSKGLPASF